MALGSSRAPLCAAPRVRRAIIDGCEMAHVGSFRPASQIESAATTTMPLERTQRQEKEKKKKNSPELVCIILVADSEKGRRKR